MNLHVQLPNLYMHVHTCIPCRNVYMYMYMYIITNVSATGLVTGDSDTSEGAGESSPVPGSGQASTESPYSAATQERQLSQRLW